MMRREFVIKKIVINDRPIRHVVVDSHLSKHKDITDDILLDLVRELDGTINLPDDMKDGFEYFVNLIILNNKQYRLVWLLENDQLYIGIITAYRDKRKK